MDEWDLDDWDLDDVSEWEEFEFYQSLLLNVADTLADQVFLSDGDYAPTAMEDYNLGYLEPEDWWPLVNQLDELLHLPSLVRVLNDLDQLLQLPGLPTELLEAPLAWLSGVLAGNLPPEPSGRKVGSRKLVKIAQLVISLTREFPETAQAAVRAWADVHRGPSHTFPMDYYDEEDMADLLLADDLPPAMSGFSMMIALTLMRWPERAEGLALPSDFAEPELYGEILAQWEGLPNTPKVTEEGIGEAEALFAQGQLAHTLAQTGMVELLTADGVADEDMSLAYSRLSRSILWVHNECRNCPERDGVACKVATDWSEQPAPLLDVASEIASTGRIAGCIRM